jgi:hypothetical protein
VGAAAPGVGPGPGLDGVSPHRLGHRGSLAASTRPGRIHIRRASGGDTPGYIPASLRLAKRRALPAQKQFVNTKCEVAGTKKHFSWTECGVVGTKNGFSWTKYADVWTQKRFVGTKCGMVWTQKDFSWTKCAVVWTKQRAFWRRTGRLSSEMGQRWTVFSRPLDRATAEHGDFVRRGRWQT